ncbi:MAG: hypothetical protein SPL08_00090 [Pseudomonadota bacterium]|nr:hypothetical protein [Pseudomonadota bacterium]
MKKFVLFLAVAISFSCLWNTQGMAGTCPAERPLLNGGTWKNENCPEFKVPTFSSLFLLNDPHWAKISFEGVCDPNSCADEDTKVLCQGLMEFDKTLADLKQNLVERYKYDYYHRRYIYEYNLAKGLIEFCEKKGENCSELRELADKLNEVTAKTLQLERDISKYNSEIVEINQIIDEKNSRVATYNNLCKVESDILKSPVNYSDFGNGLSSPTFRKIRCPSDLLKQCEKILESIIQQRLREVEPVEGEMEDNQRNNLHLVFGNIKKEKEGHAAIFEFEKFYTPEKEKQLLAEYEKTLAEKCVGCDYPEPLDVQSNSCDLCPNREYVDGKCVLKKDKK